MIDCEALESPPGTILPAWFTDPVTKRRTVLVSPLGDERLFDGAVHHTLTLEQAVSRAEDGVTIKLLPGKYYRAVSLVGKRGTAEAPIVIEGTVDGDGTPRSHICGTNAAGSIYPDLPGWVDYAFFRLRNSAHVRIRNLKVESCWPCFVYGERTHHLDVEDIDAQDGTYLAFLRGPGAHNLSVRRCRWIQDPTGSMWNAIDWQYTHHGAYAYYNGALLGGVDVERNIEVEGNHVRNAFNGVRFTTTLKDEAGVMGKFNVNCRIFSNRFENIRDNAVEPEITFLNWHVFANEIKNVHSPFSIHDVSGGYLYLYANRIWFDDRGGADYQCNRGGKIYKLRRKGVLPDYPFHVFNNSLYTRTFLIKKARAKLFFHRNNAVQICSPGDHAKCLCRPGRQFLNAFPVGENEQPLPWDDTVVFDGDATNKPFDDVLHQNRQEAHGVFAPDLGFEDPLRGNFRLRKGSPLRAAGLVFDLHPETDLPPGSPPWRNWTGDGRPNIGALQDDGLTEGPEFTPMD